MNGRELVLLLRGGKLSDEQVIGADPEPARTSHAL